MFSPKQNLVHMPLASAARGNDLSAVMTNRPDRIVPSSLSFFISAGVIGIAIFIVQALYGIYFETNDDVGMMMIAHGFGLSGVPTPTLLFSNTIQGHIIHLLSWPFGRPGYSIYLMSCLVLSSATMVYNITRLNGLFALNLFIVLVVCVRPIFAPQFTIISSFLAIAAITSFVCYRKFQSTADIFISAMLAYLAFLMRDQSLFFICLIAIPICFSPVLLRDMKIILVGVIAIVLAGAAYTYDRINYTTEAWLPYTNLNKLRAFFTDYGLGLKFWESAELRNAVGWTSNDILLLMNWWFLDPERFSPEKFSKAIEISGVLPTFSFDFTRAGHWIEQFMRPDMLPIVVLFGVSAALIRRHTILRFSMMVVIFVVLTIGFTFAGRFDVSRVLYPGVVLLIIAPLLYRHERDRVRTIGTVLGGAIAVVASVSNYITRAEAHAVRQAEVLGALQKVPPASVHVAWGADFDYEAAFPALSRRDEFPTIKLYGIGVATLAPYALAHWGGDLSRFYEQFRSRNGMSLFTSPRTPILEKYCEEKFLGKLEVLSEMHVSGQNFHYRVRCVN